MASISFYSDNVLITAGSGLGFYGNAGFGASVPVGSYQGSTWITNPAGTTEGAQGDNVTYLNLGSGLLPSISSGIGIDAIPAQRATLKIVFDHSTEVQAQNAELRIYDRSDIDEPAVGVTTRVAEIVHPWPTQQPATEGSGINDGKWFTLGGSASTLTLSPSPGPTGCFAGQGSSTKEQSVHEWHVALSASPDSIGSKTSYGLYVSLEYL